MFEVITTHLPNAFCACSIEWPSREFVASCTLPLHRTSCIQNNKFVNFIQTSWNKLKVFMILSDYSGSFYSSLLLAPRSNKKLTSKLHCIKFMLSTYQQVMIILWYCWYWSTFFWFLSSIPSFQKVIQKFRNYTFVHSKHMSNNLLYSSTFHIIYGFSSLSHMLKRDFINASNDRIWIYINLLKNTTMRNNIFIEMQNYLLMLLNLLFL